MVKRYLGNYRPLKGNLVNDQGTLTTNRLRPSEMSEQKMNQKQLEEKLEKMHQEMLSELKGLREALVEALSGGIVINQAVANMSTSAQGKAPSGAPVAVAMDESVFVTEISTDSVKKGYNSDLTTTSKAEDKKLKSSKDKLRGLKKRS